MRALVIGRGSMGKRRIRDLISLGVDVHSWDITDKVPMPRTSFDSLIISSPPLTKKARMIDLDPPCFIEAEVEVIPYPHFPSCTPRFNPIIRRVKERAALIGPVAYTLHVGMHLEDWHPGTDLTTYYAAQRKTGACREMVPFELGWLTWVFGPVTKAKALRGSLAGIADIDDVYQVVVEHAQPEKGSASVLGHLLIDAVSRPAERSITVVGREGTFFQEIRYSESVYLAEMRAFVKSVEEGEPWPYTLAEEKDCLDVLHMIERFA